jgi:hypothetical protein
MKRVFFTILLLLAGMAAFAQSKRAILKVRLLDDSPITVTIDNRVYNKHGRTITIGDMPAGNHYLKIYEYRTFRNEHGGSARLLYSGYVRTKKNAITNCVLDPQQGRLRLTTIRIDEEGEWNDRRDPEQQTNNRNTLSQNDLESIEKHVSDRITDTEKLKLLKSSLDNSNYYTEQVQKMMRWLSFESTRLDFAKWAYTGVIDAKNYWKLESEFSFSSTKEEFGEYIKGRN